MPPRAAPPSTTAARRGERPAGQGRGVRSRRAKDAVAPTVVLLVRHGKTGTTGKILPGRAPGLHLSDQGRAQAETLALRLGNLARRPSALYASPLERARETAAPTARALGLKVRTDRGLLECDMGTWTGKQLSRLAKDPRWQAVQRWPSSFRFPDGESFADLSTRTSETVLRLAAAHPGETIVAFSHADPIKAAVAAAAGVPLDLFQRLIVSPCSVSALAFTANGPHVLCVNATAGLDELVLS